eukprot:3689444-Pleurochrysis_carterae.AAC.1
MHCCSQCFEPVHSSMVCNKVWMPITGGHDFCSKEHLLLFNANADEKYKLPVRRLSPDLLPPEEPPVPEMSAPD